MRVRGFKLPFEAPITGVLVVVWGALALSVDGFATTASTSGILGRSVAEGLLAVGFTICLLGGQLDLSIASVLALSSVVMAALEGPFGTGGAAIVAVAAGALVGVVNALLVCVLGVNSFVATLGTLLAARGVAFLISQEPIIGSNLGASLWMSEDLVGPFSPRVLGFLLVVVAGHVFMNRTRWGREILATGGNRAAAQAAGVPVAAREALAFVLSGAIAGLAGVIAAMTLLAGSPTYGSTSLLLAVAAVFLGGNALAGGRGSVLASAIGVVALATLAAGLDAVFIHPGYQQIIAGSMILFVVLFASSERGEQTMFGRQLRQLAALTASLKSSLRTDAAGGGGR